MSENKSISPLDVAGFFLKLPIEEGITNLKLNKLIYLAHGYYWGNLIEPLIADGELAQAWRYGPVYRSVYNVFGRFKAEPIPPIYAAVSTEIESRDDLVPQFLEIFWDRFKHFSPWSLVKMVHEKDSPWDIVWNRDGGKHTSGSLIPDSLTKVYYINKINKLVKKSDQR